MFFYKTIQKFDVWTKQHNAEICKDNLLTFLQYKIPMSASVAF